MNHDKYILSEFLRSASDKDLSDAYSGWADGEPGVICEMNILYKFCDYCQEQTGLDLPTDSMLEAVVDEMVRRFRERAV